MNTCEYLLVNVQDSDIALIEADKARSYGDLKAAAAKIVGRLLELRIEPGDRVGILAPNSLFWIASYLAILRLGLVAVPFSLMITKAEAARNAAFAGCKAMLIDRATLSAFEGAFPPELILLSADVIEGEGPAAWPQVPANFDPSSDAALMFTSGTTAKPKAVRITHENIQANTDSIVSYLGLRREDCMLVILPFFYCFGLSLLQTHLRVGARVALCNNFTFPEMALDLMERESCTGFAGVPSSFQHLLRLSTFKTRSLPSLRHVQQAGGKLQSVLLEEFAAAKPDIKLYVMYGQTEATARLSFLPPEDLGRKLGSIGRGIPGVTLRVLDEEGNPVAPGEVGEIVARGKNISPGYLNAPEATAERFRGGELHTGDLATVDDEGFIYIVDRKDDFIKSWGYRVSSLEIESCVLRLPDVVSAAAIGVPDIEAGEAILVFITIRPESGVTEERVMEHCRREMGKHMIPREVRIIGALPLNSNGKVMKSELRRMALI